MCSLFHLVSSFNQIPVHKNTIPPRVFCTPSSLLKRLIMPKRISAALGCFVKAINEEMTGPDRVGAYLYDDVGSDADLSAHVPDINECF